MAYTDDAVRAKLSALNETQESIVTVAQWVMFHRRHADRTGIIWLQKLKEAGASKRLNLIYLANGNNHFWMFLFDVLGVCCIDKKRGMKADNSID